MRELNVLGHFPRNPERGSEIVDFVKAIRVNYPLVRMQLEELEREAEVLGKLVGTHTCGCLAFEPEAAFGLEHATVLDNDLVVLGSLFVVGQDGVIWDPEENKIIHPFQYGSYAFGTKNVGECVTKEPKQITSGGATEGVGGIESKEGGLVGDTNHNAHPLAFVQRDNAVGLCDVSNGCLGTGQETSDEGCDCLESSPCARKIVGLEVSIDGGSGVVVVRKGKVLYKSIFSGFSGFWDKRQGGRLERANFALEIFV